MQNELTERELRAVLVALDFFAEFGVAGHYAEAMPQPLDRKELSELAWRLAAPIESAAKSEGEKQVRSLLGFLHSIRVEKAF